MTNTSLARYMNDSMLYDPFRAFENILYPVSSRARRCTVSENEKSMTIEVELPGCKKGDVKVELSGYDLSVTAKHRGLNVEKYYTISDRYDLSTMTARLEDGVLVLNVDRHPAHVPRLIEIK